MTMKGAKGLGKFFLSGPPHLPLPPSGSDTFPNAPPPLPHPLSPNGTLVHPRVSFSIAGYHVNKRKGKERGVGKPKGRGQLSPFFLHPPYEF